jgi:hypothetical protein
MASLTMRRSPALPDSTELNSYSRPASPEPERWTPPSTCAAVQSRGYTRLTSGMLVTPLIGLPSNFSARIAWALAGVTSRATTT